MRWVREKVRELFGIDRRSLAAFRIGLGLMLATDLFDRSLTLREHYTAAGVFPREAALELRPDTRLLHLYLLNDSAGWVMSLFGLAFVAALCVMLGYRTRLATAVSYFLLLSVTRRNPFVTHTGDQLLQVLTFWGLFLPLGSRLSLDRLRGRGGSTPPPRVLSLATAAVLLQICLFYFMAGFFKRRYDVWTRGEALGVFANFELYARPFGVYLRDHPLVCQVFTYATLALELGAPILLLSPWFTRWIRTLLFFLLTAFHLGIQLAAYIGIFQLVSIVGITLFLPGWAWDRLGRALPASVKQLWARLCAAAERRLGRTTVTPVRARGRPAEVALQVFAGAALLFVVFTNWNGARAEPAPLPAALDRYTRPLGLNQQWHIFSDIGEKFAGWYAVPAQQFDGALVDVLREEPFQGLRRPGLFAATFANHNERRFWWNATLPKNEWLRRYLAEYLCRRWAERHGEEVYHLAVCLVGSVLGRGPVEVQELRILSRYEAPRPDLVAASPERRQEALRLRDEWRRFVAGLPERVPAGPDRPDGTRGSE